MLKSALDGTTCGAGAISAATLDRRGSYQAHDMEQSLRFEGLGHAHDGAKLMTCRVIGGLGRAGEQDYGDMLQAIVSLDDQAKIVAGHVLSFNLCEKNRRHCGAKHFKRLLGSGNNHNGVSVILQECAHGVCDPLIGFNCKNNGLQFS